MSMLMHRDRGLLAEVMDWLDWPLMALRPVAGHPMRVEDYRKGDEYVLRAELPGVDPEQDIEVTASRGILTIRAVRREDTEGRHHSEFRYGTFARRFTLPANADEDHIRAIYGHGILEITADLATDAAAEQQPRQIPVMVNHHITPS